jgi:heat shock protein HslJ
MRSGGDGQNWLINLSWSMCVMRVFRLAPILLLCVAGCTPSQRPDIASPAPVSVTRAHPLIGTNWHLIGFQPNDGSPVVRYAEPAANTLQILANGRVAMKLDCNRGMGSWMSPDTTGPMGSIQFAPIASTMMACLDMGKPGAVPMPKMEWIRGYRIDGDRLSLSMQADGGQYLWDARD